MTPTITVDEVIARIDDWKGRRVEIRPLPSGLTNKNFRVDVDSRPYFVRIPGTGSELFINRRFEHFNTVAAGEAGVSPKVLYYLEPESVMVLEYVTGTTMSNQSLQSSEAIKKVVRSLKIMPFFG